MKYILCYQLTDNHTYWNDEFIALEGDSKESIEEFLLGKLYARMLELNLSFEKLTNDMITGNYIELGKTEVPISAFMGEGEFIGTQYRYREGVSLLTVEEFIASNTFDIAGDTA